MSRCGWCRMPRVPGEIGTTWNFLCGSSTSCAVHQQQSEACKEIKRLQEQIKAMKLGERIAEVERGLQVQQQTEIEQLQEQIKAMKLGERITEAERELQVQQQTEIKRLQEQVEAMLHTWASLMSLLDALRAEVKRLRDERDNLLSIEPKGGT